VKYNIRYKTVLAMVVLLLMVIVIVGLFINDQLQRPRGFGIYLSENNELVIGDKDIIFYNKTSHQIKINEGGINRTQKMDLYHKSFIVKLNGREMYNGTFWSDIDSMSNTGIVITDIIAIQNGLTNIVRIVPCYAPVIFCKGVDPRNNSEIFDYFQNIGKLVK
jgi:hypothetical protein